MFIQIELGTMMIVTVMKEAPLKLKLNEQHLQPRGIYYGMLR